MKPSINRPKNVAILFTRAIVPSTWSNKTAKKYATMPEKTFPLNINPDAMRPINNPKSETLLADTFNIKNMGAK